MAETKISHSIPLNTAVVQTIQRAVAAEYAMQIESAQDLNQYFELAAFNPMQRMGTFKELHELRSNLSQKKTETEEAEEPKILEVEKIDEVADRFQKNNYELNAKSLLILRERITANDTPEEILSKVTGTYADPALADEALDFLIETAPDPKTLDVVKRAKEAFNSTFAREITSGKNMGLQAREFSQAGLGSPTSLRDLYRDITGTPRDPLVLFNELTERFRYEKMKSVIQFMLRSLGADLRAKGASIPRGELKRLIDETRSLQGILGVFRFFQSRTRLIQRQFASYNLILPPRLDFETLAKLFIKLLAERFVNAEKILQTARILGVADEVAAQIILFTQMRDGLKQVAPRYFRNPMHRDELWKAYLDALENLEDQLEEEEEKEDK